MRLALILRAAGLVISALTLWNNVSLRKDSQIQREEEVEGLRDRTQRDVVETHGTAGAPVKQIRKEAAEKVGRNDPCPCGSGKKYKKCCGK